MDVASKKPSYSASPTRSLVKAVSILQCFSYDQSELSISDIVRKVEIPRATVHRMLTTLVATGLLGRSAATGRYRIGPKLYTMGSLYLATTDILSAAEPVTQLLNELTRESVKLSVFDMGNVVVIKKEEARHHLRYHHAVGTILPAYASAMGKAFLSEISEAELDTFYPGEALKPLTIKTIATKAELKRELQEIRRTGVSFDMEGNTLGVIGVASVIRDRSGKAVVAMSIGVQSHLTDERRTRRLAELVRMGARLISYHLGYQDREVALPSLEAIRSWWDKDVRVARATLVAK